jgi:hypothetical protein
VVVSRDAAQMARHAASFDLIIDKAGASHDLDAYTALLKPQIEEAFGRMLGRDVKYRFLTSSRPSRTGIP